MQSQYCECYWCGLQHQADGPHQIIECKECGEFFSSNSSANDEEDQYEKEHLEEIARQEQRELENREMEKHFREHPHG